MVNDLHRLGPGSVGVGGGGRRRKAQNGMNSKQTSTSEASLAVGGATPPVIIYVGERRCRTTLPVHKHS